MAVNATVSYQAYGISRPFCRFVTSRSLFENHETSKVFRSEEYVYVWFVYFLSAGLPQSCNDFHDLRSLQVIM